MTPALIRPARKSPRAKATGRVVLVATGQATEKENNEINEFVKSLARAAAESYASENKKP